MKHILSRQLYTIGFMQKFIAGVLIFTVFICISANAQLQSKVDSLPRKTIILETGFLYNNSFTDMYGFDAAAGIKKKSAVTGIRFSYSGAANFRLTTADTAPCLNANLAQIGIYRSYTFYSNPKVSLYMKGAVNYAQINIIPLLRPELQKENLNGITGALEFGTDLHVKKSFYLTPFVGLQTLHTFSQSIHGQHNKFPFSSGINLRFALK